DGMPITDYCDRNRLSIDARLALFRQVCLAVQYAHQNLIVHRDLKPSNILVTPEGVSKLLDFGIAKLLNPNLAGYSVAMTRAEERVMTPAYASPEQVRGETITTASDVYSLGVLLYELLAGHRPYLLKGRLEAEVIRVICQEEPQRPSTAVSSGAEEVHADGMREPLTAETITAETISAARGASVERLHRQLQGDLDTIVLMALKKEPGRRYGSVEQFAEDLRRYAESLPVVARRDTVGYRARKFAGRHRVGVAMAVVLVVLLAGFAAAMGVLQARTAQALTQAREQTRLATSGKLALQARENLDFRLDRALLASLEAYRAAPTLDAQGSLLTAVQYNPLLEQFLEGHTSVVRSVAFSPDGARLASGSGDGTIRLWSVETGQVLTTLKGHTAPVTSVVFSPDGTRLASGSGDQTIRLWDLEVTSWQTRACHRANRNLTYTEWRQLLGKEEPYRKTCEELPLHPSVLEEGQALAKVGDITGAVAIFRRALALEPTLDFDPKQKARVSHAEDKVEQGRRTA
ncbi:MAG: serine/threonine protein kinase, partial [Dehalococcoidia bacterium]